MNEDMEDLTPLELLGRAVDMLEWMLDEIKEIPGGSRGRALALTKLQEAHYWLTIGLTEEESKPTHE